MFFLGGCTYTEIAALRWVGRQNKGKYCYQNYGILLHVLNLTFLAGRRFLIATTGMINGATITEGIATGVRSAESKVGAGQ